MFQEFLADYREWAAHPFSSDMDWKHWAYFILLIMLLILLWNIVLFHLFKAIQEI